MFYVKNINLIYFFVFINYFNLLILKIKKIIITHSQLKNILKN